MIGRIGGSERPYQQHELPALLFGKSFLKGGHRFSSLADFIEKVAVGGGVHLLGVGQARWRWVIHGRVGSVAFPGFSVALNAFVEINHASSGQGSRRKLDGVLPRLGFLRDLPFPVLIERHRDTNKNHGE